jgi:hypothetical protein
LPLKQSIAPNVSTWLVQLIESPKLLDPKAFPAVSLAPIIDNPVTGLVVGPVTSTDRDPNKNPNIPNIFPPIDSLGWQPLAMATAISYQTIVVVGFSYQGWSAADGASN